MSLPKVSRSLRTGARPFFDVSRCDELMLVAQRRSIEGPDLDGFNAVAVDQLMHDLFRLFVEVVAVAEAGVVEANLRVGLPA